MAASASGSAQMGKKTNGLEIACTKKVNIIRPDYVASASPTLAATGWSKWQFDVALFAIWRYFGEENMPADWTMLYIKTFNYEKKDAKRMMAHPVTLEYNEKEDLIHELGILRPFYTPLTLYFMIYGTVDEYIKDGQELPNMLTPLELHYAIDGYLEDHKAKGRESPSKIYDTIFPGWRLNHRKSSLWTPRKLSSFIYGEPARNNLRDPKPIFDMGAKPMNEYFHFQDTCKMKKTKHTTSGTSCYFCQERPSDQPSKMICFIIERYARLFVK